MSRKSIITISILLALLPLLAALRVSAEDSTWGLKISEIKLGGGNEPKEFIEIFNDTDSGIDLNYVRIEYAKAGFNPTYCRSLDWKSHANPSSQVTTKILNGNIAAHSFAVIELSLTDNSSGSLRLSKNNGIEVTNYDLVGWGESSPCFEVAPANTPASGKSIKRSFDSQGKLNVASPANNSEEFTLSDVPLPGDDQCLMTDCYADDAEEVLSYSEVKITELLPDPASPKIDTQDEFIELFNPNTEPINLENYVLYTSSQSTTYKYVIQDIILKPGEYRALFSSTTHLTLVNSTGRAWITAPDGTLLDETDWYSDDVGSDQSWALFENGWKVSTTATPNAPNQFSEEDELAIISTAIQPCPEGKFRNPDSGRCKNIVIAAAAKPCKTNQVRNLETNRCRNIATVASVKPCNPGYERNIDTNRCRKVASSAAKSFGTSIDQKTNTINYLIIITLSGIMIIYAIYEYRQDLKNLYFRISQRIKGDNKEMVQ